MTVSAATLRQIGAPGRYRCLPAAKAGRITHACRPLHGGSPARGPRGRIPDRRRCPPVAGKSIATPASAPWRPIRGRAGVSARSRSAPNFRRLHVRRLRTIPRTRSAVAARNDFPAGTRTALPNPVWTARRTASRRPSARCRTSGASNGRFRSPARPRAPSTAMASGVRGGRGLRPPGSGGRHRAPGDRAMPTGAASPGSRRGARRRERPGPPRSVPPPYAQPRDRRTARQAHPHERSSPHRPRLFRFLTLPCSGAH